LAVCPWLVCAAAAASTEIEEIVVTAQKRESAIQDTPIAMSAVPASAIDRQQIDGVREVQQIAPNLVFNSLGGTTNLYMRGVGTDINDSLAEPGVAMYVDGVYQGVSGDQSAIYEDLERIEVLRGPQGTLYGRNSTGGNVQLITQQPSFDPGGVVSVLGGSDDRMKTAINATGGLVPDLLAARANLVVDRRAGVRENEFNGNKVEKLDDFWSDLSFLYTPSESLDVLLRGNYSERRDDTPRWAYLEVVPGSGLNPLMFGGAPASQRGEIMNNDRTRYETRAWVVSGTVTWNVGAFTLKSISAYR
jgi:iron complex outermembrane receptor protein